ncbi:glycerophosphodiester phosphodiesterase [Paludisphaera mucosa]|uniref:Glycerophosphodiester phosphodiesterase n=1 Tax=Paludisphaera mucosa TaxID=3030827 RepID=A0ABT6FGX0_9BACT|nr:glycerophosphodiester phosphodiesterase [Paludisphaera mucosa]MDG3006769.1 glycerophosphodiester phosphodiesterase [Paludisphaera mucosa]
MAVLPSLLLVLTMATTTQTDSKAVEIVAHRGESADAPENTMAAFKLAWSRKVEAIELDVHLSRDGVLVVSHDGDTKRTTGVAKEIKESAWSDLKGLDAGRWKNPKFAGEPLPTLDEALATIPDGARCFIEVKTGPEAVPALVEAVRRSGKKPAQTAVISFHADTVAEAKKRLPELKAYYLASFKRDPKTNVVSPTVDELISKAKELNADGLDLDFKGPIDRAFVDRVKSAGLALYVWTVDDPAIARRLIEAGVDGITTNKAEWLKGQLRRD